MNKVYAITEWIYRIALLNLLTVLFSVIGLVIFGFFPALMTSFSITRKWIQGENEFSVLPTFWHYFKKDFLTSNGIGLIYLLMAFILYSYYTYIQATIDSALIFTHIPLYLIALMIILTLLYVPAVFVHYQTGLIQVFKNAWLIMIYSPLHTGLLVILLGGALYILFYIPGAIFFFGISVSIFIMTSVCQLAFQSFEEKQKKYTGGHKK